MASVDSYHGPSSAEIQELVTLFSRMKPGAPDVPSMLRLIHGILAPKWVRNYIFTDSPIHIQHMVSSTASMPSLLWANTATFVGLGSPPPTASSVPAESHQYSGHCLLVPVFAYDNKTIGVGVYLADVLTTSHFLSNTTANDKMELDFRFVYDSGTKTLLKIFDLPEDHIYVVMTSTLMNSTQVRFCRSYFLRDSLRSLAINEDEFGLHHLMINMNFAYDVLYNHNCSVCESNCTKFCKCVVDLPVPTGQHDFSAFFKAIPHFTYCSMAVSTKCVFSSDSVGRTVSYSQFAAYVNTSSELDPDTILRMCSWSIWNFTKDLREDPLQSARLIGAADIDESSEAANKLGCDSAEGRKSDDRAGVRKASGFEALRSPNLRNGTALMNQLLGFGTSPPRRKRRPPFNAPDPPHQTSISGREAHVAADTSYEDLSIVDSGAHDEGKPDTHNQLGLLQRNQDVSVGQLVKHIKKSESDERRKQRNRVSARKSNLKKRQRHEQMEADLKATHSKIEALRDTETKLRRENLTLRAALSCLNEKGMDQNLTDNT